MKRVTLTLLAAAFLAAAAGCGSSAGVTNAGTPGDPAVREMPIPGTVFTIVFENEDESNVIGNPSSYLTELARTYSSAAAYIGEDRPSLPNYIVMTSGSNHGIADDSGPSAHPIAGTDHLAAQLDAAGIRWRAYMESMGTPCNPAETATSNSGDYAVKHNPFMYYTSVHADDASCRDHIVDFEQNFAADLSSDAYRYMWITPNLCNDMHDCPTATGDAWLRRVVPQIMASPGYQRGGAIFILFDEGNTGGAQRANIAAVVISPRLASPGFRSTTAYNHRSYLATVEDIFHLPRLATTRDATPMSDFFLAAPTTPTTPPPATPPPGGGSP
jgi:hypothetical protein